MLQELSASHYNHVISFQEFRAKRREILNQIDTYYNGETQIQSEDKTVIAEEGFGSTLSFGSYESIRDEQERSNSNSIDLDKKSDS